MNSFDKIPTDILRIIQRYLSKQDYRNLLNTNNTIIFEHAKYETVYYDLKIGCYDLRQLPDSLSVFDWFVKDKSQQISLTITDSRNKIVNKWAAFIQGIHKLIVHQYELLPKCVNMNMSLFCNIYHVHLKLFNKVILSGLKGVKILEVYDSPSLIVIDFIPGLKRLVLDSLINLLEISEYGGIPELQITRCPNLSSEGLGNHERVSLTCWDEPYDISRFRTVRYLELAGRDLPRFEGFSRFENLIYLVLACIVELPGIRVSHFDPSYFPNLCFLYLNHAKISSAVSFPSSLQFAEFHRCSFEDLIVLSNAKKLHFHSCKGRSFNNVNVLSAAYRLHLVFINELEDVSSLGGVYDLRIANCHHVKDISKLGEVRRLQVLSYGINNLGGLGQGNCDVVISCLPGNIEISSLRSIYKVTLRSCEGVINGRDLAYVQHLTISCCKCFEDTSALGNVKSLRLIECFMLRRLVGLENVPHIHLESCNQLEDIDCLGKQQSLVILTCAKLKELMEEDVSERHKTILAGIPFVRTNDARFSLCPLRDRSETLPGIFDMKAY